MNEKRGPLVLIRGVGEIASAVAHTLHGFGIAAAVQASRPPIAIRRRMAFSDAVFDGSVELAGLTARRVETPQTAWDAGEVPLLYRALDDALATARWDVLVDARMAKHTTPERQIGLAPLVIGMGPGCTAGDNVDVGIETSWDGLGTIVWRGSTKPLRGEPRSIKGHARERFSYAPQAGIVHVHADIGAEVAEGDIIARVDDAPVVAAFAGVVRGVTRHGVPVAAGNKIVELDPRIGEARLSGIDERPRQIAEAVAEIVTRKFGVSP